MGVVFDFAFANAFYDYRVINLECHVKKVKVILSGDYTVTGAEEGETRNYQKPVYFQKHILPEIAAVDVECRATTSCSGFKR